MAMVRKKDLVQLRAAVEHAEEVGREGAEATRAAGRGLGLGAVAAGGHARFDGRVRRGARAGRPGAGGGPAGAAVHSLARDAELEAMMLGEGPAAANGTIASA
jgi:hypothetical protein